MQLPVSPQLQIYCIRLVGYIENGLIDGLQFTDTSFPCVPYLAVQSCENNCVSKRYVLGLSCLSITFLILALHSLYKHHVPCLSSTFRLYASHFYPSKKFDI
jgi:hypothetical protein